MKRVGSVLLAMTIGCAFAVLTIPCVTLAVDLAPSQSVTTTNPGWEDSFGLDWDVEDQGPGGLRISGYVLNRMTEPAVDVTLLIQVFDSTGALSAQRLQLIAPTLPRRSRLRFESPPLPSGDRFRVTVWSWGTARADTR